MLYQTRILKALVTGILLVVIFSIASAARINDISSTKHNLSATSGNNTRAATEDEICVFCHTPHGATTPNQPLWNRSLNEEAYTLYESSSLDADPAFNTGPNGKTKLCLSCHDGTIALGSLASRETDVTFDGGVTTMPDGSGASTGFTRNLGTDLSNDHPVSFRYDDQLANDDTEMRQPSAAAHIDVRSSGNRPQYPLEAGNEMHCTTCHDPHVSGTDVPAGTSLLAGQTDNIKFLRGKRFQMATPTGTTYTEATDIVCLACHEKLGDAWNLSVHANDTDATEDYKDAAADQREFPRGIQVWQAGCLNCHDTHAVAGTRRLLREGTDAAHDPTIPTAKSGGNPALEETCYQCHTTSANSILATTTDVPDIESEFGLSYKMPITNTASTNTVAGNELAHDIGGDPDYGVYPIALAPGANFLEHPESLGSGGDTNLANRHAECTDCHNPHRMIKNEKYDGSGSNTKATHDHTGGLNHNDAPGALKGTFGVDVVSWTTIPTAWSQTGEENTNISFGTLPTFFDIKCGVTDAGCNGVGSSPTGKGQVTKEYQVCLKCHSNFAYDDNGNPDGHPSGTGRPDAMYNDSVNPLSTYTNQAMEFQAPTSHQGDINTATNSGAHSRYDGQYIYRSWHPVMDKTGRDRAGGGTWLAPWNTNLGNQTMMCSDCHNNGTNGKAEGSSTDVGGPHGSANRKILRGPWTDISDPIDTGPPDNTPFCADCHTGLANPTGFDHDEHEANAVDFICSRCHIAIPHGWKNKSFVANLNDVGPEVLCDVPNNYTPNCTVGQPIPKGTVYEPNSRYYNPPYYLGTQVKVMTWEQAGTWSEASCGELGGQQAQTWMDAVCK